MHRSLSENTAAARCGESCKHTPTLDPVTPVLGVHPRKPGWGEGVYMHPDVHSRAIHSHPGWRDACTSGQAKPPRLPGALTAGVQLGKEDGEGRGTIKIPCAGAPG